MTSTLVEATGDFVKHSRPTRQQLDNFKELFYTLALKCSSNERQTLSSLLASYPYTPRAIAIYFSIHEGDMATTMLSKTPVLSDRDFAAIIAKTSIEHALAIAERNDLGARTVDALMSVEDPEGKVLETLRANETLIADEILAAKLDGEDLTTANKQPIDEQEHKLISNIENTVPSHQEAGKYAAQVIAETPTVVKETMEAASNSQAEPSHPSGPDIIDKSDELMALASMVGSTGNRPATSYQDDAGSTRPSLANRLLAASRGHNHEKFSLIITSQCELPSAIVLNALKQQDSGLIATILKALDVNDTIVTRILLLMAPSLGRNREILRMVMESYRMMQQKQCIDYLETLGAQFKEPVMEQVSQSRLSGQRITTDFGLTRVSPQQNTDEPYGPQDAEYLTRAAG